MGVTRVEPLEAVSFSEIDLEGLWDQAQAAMDRTGVHPIRWFWRFWADAHGYRRVPVDELPGVECRRIEWRYLDDPERVS